MEQEEKDYIKGFNNGYLLAEHQPELLNKIAGTIDRNNPYCDGLVSGKEEYEIEKAKNYFKKFDKGDSSGKEKDKGKDKDGIEVKR